MCDCDLAHLADADRHAELDLVDRTAGIRPAIGDQVELEAQGAGGECV